MMTRRGVGAEPGIDPRRESAFMNYGHIRQKCLIEVVDYSAVRSSFGRMTNTEFVRLISDERASAREPWVKVRWINVGGISWDVISALAIKYGERRFSPSSRYVSPRRTSAQNNYCSPMNGVSASRVVELVLTASTS